MIGLSSESMSSVISLRESSYVKHSNIVTPISRLSVAFGNLCGSNSTAKSRIIVSMSCTCVADTSDSNQQKST